MTTLSLSAARSYEQGGNVHHRVRALAASLATVAGLGAASVPGTAHAGSHSSQVSANVKDWGGANESGRSKEPAGCVVTAEPRRYPTAGTITLTMKYQGRCGSNVTHGDKVRLHCG